MWMWTLLSTFLSDGLSVTRGTRTFHAMMRFVTVLLFFVGIALCGHYPLSAQADPQTLEQQRRDLQREISTIQQLYSRASQSREAELPRLIATRRQVENREKLIGVLRAEIRQSQQRIERSNEMITMLQNDIDNLQEEYAAMLRQAYRRQQLQNDWLFLFSARSFNDAYLKWQLLRRYDNYREKQARLILLTRQSLQRRANMLAEEKMEQERLLEAEQQQKTAIQQELQEMQQLYNSLSREENRLKTELAQKRRAEARLARAIEEAIAAAAAARETFVAAESAEMDEIERKFALNKGRLPWPVKSGFVSSRFGRQQHPTLRSVIIQNNGIDIQTEHQADVLAVFDGIVQSVEVIPQYSYVIIIQHGSYYTTYSHISSSRVKRGDRVVAGQPIGIVKTNNQTNVAELHFELWNHRDRQDPSEWLSRSIR